MFQVLAVNDRESFCECCGRQGLKRVVWILDTERGEHKHFGTVCAMQPVKGFGVDAEIKRAISDFDRIEKTRARVASFDYRKLGGRYEAASHGAWRPADKEMYSKCFADACARHPFAVAQVA